MDTLDRDILLNLKMYHPHNVPRRTLVLNLGCSYSCLHPNKVSKRLHRMCQLGWVDKSSEKWACREFQRYEPTKESGSYIRSVYSLTSQGEAISKSL